MTLRPAVRLASIGFALALGAAACSSSSSSGTGGSGGGIVSIGGSSGALGGATGTAGTSGAAGGTTGTAGTSGVGGTSGGAGGASGVVSCGALPSCVASVVATCPLISNSCLVAASAVGNASIHDICFGNGVKVVDSVTNDPSTGAGSTSITVTKSGVVCYTLDGAFNAQDPLTTPRILSFKNALGIEVATFATDYSTFPNTTMVTCTGGVAMPVADFGNCGMPNSPEPDQCTGGLCVAP